MDSSDFLRAIDAKAKKLAKRAGLPEPKPFKIRDVQCEKINRLRELSDAPLRRDVQVTKYHHHATGRGPRQEGTMKEASTVQDTKLLLTQERLKTCKHCGMAVFHMVSPAGFPINTTAVICAHCARTKGFFDELATDKFLDVDPTRERPSREMVSTRRSSHPVYTENEQHELVVRGLELRIDYEQIAEDVGVNILYVQSVAINMGHLKKISAIRAVRAQGIATNPELAANLFHRIKEMRDQGSKMWEIAKELKLSPTTVRKIMRHFGLETPDEITLKNRVKARELYQSGKRIFEIANELGITAHTVCLYTKGLERHKITRTKGKKELIKSQTFKEVKQNLQGRTFIN